MDKYTKFILTVIAVALVGILFKGEISNKAYAGQGYTYGQILYQVERVCKVSGVNLKCMENFK
jgi:hypothetical protein